MANIKSINTVAGDSINAILDVAGSNINNVSGIAASQEEGDSFANQVNSTSNLAAWWSPNAAGPADLEDGGTAMQSMGEDENPNIICKTREHRQLGDCRRQHRRNPVAHVRMRVVPSGR